MRERLTTAGEVAGAALVVAGIAQLSAAAALIAAGVLTITGSWLAAR